jgi:hypothetical protein
MKYLELVKKHNEKEKELEDLSEEMEKAFVGYLAENKSETLKKLEDYFKTKIKRICFLRYENDNRNYTNMVLINKDEEIIRVEINSSTYWEWDDEENVLYEDDFKRDDNYEIFNILEDLFFSYPHIKKEYV